MLKYSIPFRDPWWNDGFLFNIDKLYSLGFNRFKIANSV